jgi:hypothetical protein
VVEQRLKLKVNREKSRVVPASVMTMLGFGVYFTRGGVRIRADPKAIKRLTGAAQGVDLARVEHRDG